MGSDANNDPDWCYAQHEGSDIVIYWVCVSVCAHLLSHYLPQHTVRMQH